MKNIGLLSDTHGFIHPRIINFFKDCDELWHAGDIGNLHTADELAGFKPFTAVYGNIDNHEVRAVYPESTRFYCEETEVLITHIGGYPGNYDQRIRPILKTKTPDLFICGHSHILKVIYDKQFHMLHMNPGAAGKSGFHQLITALRFEIDGKRIQNLEILELPRR